MANLYTRKQVAELIGKTPGYVGIYVHREQLIEENKRIDLDNITNKAFINKFLTKEVEQKSEPDTEQNETKKGVNQGNIDYISKQHELKLKQIKLKNEEITLQKKQAQIIPVDFATDLFSIYFKGNISGLTNNIGSLIDNLVDELEGDYKMKLAYRKKLNQSINDVILGNHDKLNEEIAEKAKEYSLNTNKW